MEIGRVSGSGCSCWKMIRTQLLEVEDNPDAVPGSGRGSGRSCWKWKMIRMQLLEVEEDQDLAGSGCSCWKMI